MDERLAEHGIAFHHLSVLGHLSRQPGLSYSELARRAGVSVPSMQATIAHLHDAGLVSRGAGAGQGRRADLTLTERGRRVLLASEEAVRAVDDRLLDGLAPADRRALTEVLMRLFRSSLGHADGP